MKVSLSDVSYISSLAHLELTGEEMGRMVQDLNAILGHIETLNELDTSEIEPMAALSLGNSEGKNGRDPLDGLRADQPRLPLPHNEALVNAPVHNEDFFKVPKVIER